MWLTQIVSSHGKWLTENALAITDALAMGNEIPTRFPSAQVNELICYEYDAGCNNLFELCCYINFVTPDNFQPLKLVGNAYCPNENTRNSMLGITLFASSRWAWVLWLDGQISRVRIGSCGKYELVYAQCG